MSKGKERIAVVVRLLFILFIIIATFTYAMFQGGTVSWSIFYIILPFMLYSLALFFYPLSDISAKRMIRTPVVERGGKLIVSLSLIRKSRFPLLYTLACDRWEETELEIVAKRKSEKLFVFGFKKQVEWEYVVEQMPRGQHVLQSVEVEVSDFFGWMKKTFVISEKDIILVMPKTTEIHYVPVDTQFDRGAMSSPFNIVKDTTMATGVRDYQPGDRVTWIHWKSFARTEALMTKEFEDRRSQDLYLLVDGMQSPAFEEQMELAASILMEASKQQTRMAFETTGSTPIHLPLIESEEQLHTALVHLAKIKPTLSDTPYVSTKYETAMQHGGAIIMITGNPDEHFIESVLLNTQTMKSVICFVIQKNGDKLNATLQQKIRFAKSKGIAVHVLKPEKFSQAFKEVTRK